MGLSIRTTDIELGIKTTPCRFRMNSEMADLRLHQEHCRVEIKTQKPEVKIDQSKCFSDEGIKSNSEFAREAAARGYKKAMQYIGKVARDGGRMAAIQHKGNVIAEIAVRDALKTNEFVLGFIPRSLPEIRVTGNIDVQWVEPGNAALNGVYGEYDPASLETEFDPAKVNIYVRRYPAVDIKYEGKLDILI
jgi:hypothetical protein